MVHHHGTVERAAEIGPVEAPAALRIGGACKLS
jgi:hypothetical protein